MQSRSLRRRAALVAATTGVVGALAAPAALAQSSATTVPLRKAGSTALKLDRGTARALARLGVSVAPISPAKASGRTVRFPITSGSLDPKTVAPALISHSGGLRLSRGRTQVRLRNFAIRVGDKATLSAVVGNARAAIADLDLSKAKITRPRVGGPGQITTRVSRVRVKLSSIGAKALNAAFRTTAFKRGLVLGTAVVDARPSELILESGNTALTLDPTTAGVLTGAGIAPAAIAPATTPSAGVFSFPIATSRIASTLLSGTIAHTGGISLTKAATKLDLTNFDIKLGPAVTLAASVGGAAPKVEILNLDLSGAVTRAQGTTGLVVSGVSAVINDAASTALTSTFGTPSTAGAKLGTAVITATAR